MHANQSQLQETHNVEEVSEMVTIQDAAKLLCISDRQVYRYVKSNLLSRYELPNNKKIYLKREEVMGLFQKAA